MPLRDKPSARSSKGDTAMTILSESERVTEVDRRFTELYGTPPEFIVRAPGRVNLIGEHTDYNDGFVFPAAIDRDVLIAGRTRNDKQVRCYALNFNQTSTFPIDDVRPAREGREKWSNYLRAMAWVFHKEGLGTRG